MAYIKLSDLFNEWNVSTIKIWIDLDWAALIKIKNVGVFPFFLLTWADRIFHKIVILLILSINKKQTK
jgi:hypothetical protein